MTKRAIVFVVLIALLGMGIYLLAGKEKVRATASEEIDFSFQEIDDIDRIFFTNKAGKKIDLQKIEDGKWTLNQKHIAWQKKVDFLLEKTIKKVKVKGTAPKPARNYIIKNMAITGIKVMLYTKGNKEASKVYYVGGTTPDQTGTYFWTEGASTPYVTYIPGFNGFLTSRFDLEEENWISRTIFEYPKEKIDTIEVLYPDEKFLITRTDTLFSLFKDGQELPANQQALVSYVTHFRKLNMEAPLTLDENKRDSILNSKPFCVISVKPTNEKKKSLSFYRRLSFDKMHSLYDKDGKRLAYDPSRFYGRVNDSKQVLLVQDYTFGKVLKKAQDFLAQ